MSRQGKQFVHAEVRMWCGRLPLAQFARPVYRPTRAATSSASFVCLCVQNVAEGNRLRRVFGSHLALVSLHKYI